MPTFFDARVHQGKAMRLKSWDYTWAWWFYVTICTHDRRSLFGEVRGDRGELNQLGRIVEKAWMRTARVRPGVELDAYVIMPNHLHGIIALPYERVAPTTSIPAIRITLKDDSRSITRASFLPQGPELHWSLWIGRAV